MRSSMIFVIFAILIAFTFATPFEDKLSVISLAYPDGVEPAACALRGCQDAKQNPKMRSLMIFVIFAILFAFTMADPIEENLTIVSAAEYDGVQPAACSQPGCHDACLRKHGVRLIRSWCSGGVCWCEYYR
ncbi:hypothetical protein PVAND_009049 [Polypedilum vanderplanki]|uniref:Defensin n=1 Tax=Polypedilum vanderplanki TaxID=319348 RepID=A0A9J6CBH7_POLVA|nr:hypothetical protein PVAND_009049 [Polypedilum vanderplanki]